MTKITSVSSSEPVAAAVSGNVGWFLVGCLPDTDGLSQISIGKVPFTVGRAAKNDLTLRSRNVSKFHARIIVAVEVVVVEDLGSTNGSFVNGKQIFEPTPIGDGDLVQFADMEFRLGRSNSASGERTAVSHRPEEGWLISRVHEFVNHERFHMVYQPIIAAEGLRAVGVEALVRCDVEGLESPVELFDAAARLGLHERVSSMCRIKAVRTLGDRWPARQLFLNTHSGEFLGPELIQTLGQLRYLAGNRPLVLEIHEAAVPEVSAMHDFRRELRKLGIGLAYDDFGAGQSRLLELTEAPPDYLKFDRLLVRDEALASKSHRALLQTLVRHATAAGTATVAEGVETQSSVDVCRDLGFTHFQGYHFFRPLLAEELPPD